MIKNDKNIDIECLRAIAILFVLLHHLPVLYQHQSIFPYWFELNFGFWTGVDLFFVISGFLIAKSLIVLYGDTSVKKVILYKYFIKRIFRIFPAALFWIIIALCFVYLLPENKIYPKINTLTNDAIAASLNVANFYYTYCFGSGQYGQLCSKPLVLGHYWSLSLEEQFYLILPFTMIFLPRKLFFILLSLIIAYGFIWSRPIFGLGYFTRSDGLIWGVILAYLYNFKPYLIIVPFLSKINRGLMIGFVSLLLVLLAGLSKAGGASLASLHQIWTPALSFIGLVSAILVFLAVQDKGYIAGSGFIRAILSYIGSRSYSIYLCHTPLFIASIVIFEKINLSSDYYKINIFLFAILVVAISSEFTFRYIEKPSQDFGKNLANRF